MMQEQLTKRYYYLVCDQCGEQAPGSLIQDEAIDQAIEAGWQRRHRWNGLAYVHTDLCADCAEKGD